MSAEKVTVGEYLATYLRHVGIDDYFAIPGDFNLLLLDEMLKNKDLRLISCCNELNAGYAADGYARANGLSALVITYSVGALSAVNAIAGAYSENLPVIVISGGPNSNSLSRGEQIHHSLGELRYDYVRRVFSEITALSVIIQHPSEVASGIHRAISTAIAQYKPVYIEIACNIVQDRINMPRLPSVTSLFTSQSTDQKNLEAAINHANALLNNAKQSVIVLGSKARVALKQIPGNSAPIQHAHAAENPVWDLIEKSQFATAVMADAKGVLVDSHPSNIGVYWGDVSIPSLATAEVIEGSDAYIFIGPAFTDYSTCGGTLKFDKTRMIQVDWHVVQIEEQTYYNVEMLDFIRALTKSVIPNRTALEVYASKVPHHHQIAVDGKNFWGANYKKTMTDAPEDPITNQRLVSQIQKLILDQPESKYTILAETGDAWFSSLKLRLPEHNAHEVQMAYGSIGWSVGATLGYALAAAKYQRRVVALIGDGSFQETAQEVSTMIRYHVNPIIFLLNNFGYAIEEEIHKGPYNRIKNWDYAGLIKVFNASELDQESFGKGAGHCVKKNKDLDAAIAQALAYKAGPTLIEVQVEPSDCNKEMSIWGRAVSEFNSRKDALRVTQGQ